MDSSLNALELGRLSNTTSEHQLQHYPSTHCFQGICTSNSIVDLSDNLSTDSGSTTMIDGELVAYKKLDYSMVEKQINNLYYDLTDY